MRYQIPAYVPGYSGSEKENDFLHVLFFMYYISDMTKLYVKCFVSNSTLAVILLSGEKNFFFLFYYCANMLEVLKYPPFFSRFLTSTF